VTQSQDTNTHLEVSYYKNLKSCVPSLKDPCERYTLPSTPPIPSTKSSSNAITSTTNKPKHKSSSNVNVIVAVVVPVGVLLVAVIVIVLWQLQKRKVGKKKGSDTTDGSASYIKLDEHHDQ
jgi:hypothetical protein